ncbi:ankyrin repeat-containing domain protein [Hyaloraphidium curvatum]|nr:ankyrin repeat-containing domain protein [Hyaloraphidium curvatum]
MLARLLRPASSWTVSRAFSMTPLHAAARTGDRAAVERADPAQLNSRDASRAWTPLHYAARNNHVGVIQQLLAAGADPWVRDPDGRTPADLAYFWSALQSWELLRDKTPNGFSTEDSAVFGSAEKVNVFGGNPLKR